MTRRIHAPLTKEQVQQLRADAKNVAATAVRKGLLVHRSDLLSEKQAAAEHFDLGCWLFHYSTRVGGSGPTGTKDRIDCVRRLWDAGIKSPSYEFHSVFDFGERQFDSCFEMGDDDQVAAGLISAALERPHSQLADIVRGWGWAPRPALAASLARLQAFVQSDAGAEGADEAVESTTPRERG
jgi:hypothetical protein